MPLNATLILHLASATSPPNHILAFAAIFERPSSPRHRMAETAG